jgi:hypothetical protein
MKGINFDVEDEDTTHVAEAIVDDLAAFVCSEEQALNKAQVNGN